MRTGSRISDLKYKLMTIELLNLAKNYYTYRELAQIIGLPETVLSRYVKGHVLPTIDRAQNINRTLQKIMRLEGESWAFVSGPIRRPDGSGIDWMDTSFAHQADEGMMDGDVGIVLLNRADGGWRVVEAVVGPTDMPQVGWPDEHHVSPALVGQEGG